MAMRSIANQRQPRKHKRMRFKLQQLLFIRFEQLQFSIFSIPIPAIQQQQ